MLQHAAEKTLEGGDTTQAVDEKGPMGAFEERQRGPSHERTFWKAWRHIAMWREQEVKALKEGKAWTFCRRQSRWAMTVLFGNWRIRTLESRTGTIYCDCCDMWLNGPGQYALHLRG